MSQDARVNEERATQRRAMVLGLSYADTSIGEKPLYKDLLTSDELRQYRAIPIYADPHHINFGVTNTTSQQTMKTLQDRFLDQRVSFSLISDTGFKDYMLLYDPPKKIEYQDVKLSKETDIDLFTEVTQTLDKVLADDILAYLVKQTYQLKGSDIHLENQKEAVRVRIRVDGVLHPIASLSHEKYHQLLSSIAIAANVSTGNADPQTGHINHKYKLATGDEVTVNLRVETVPTVYGMDVVMRIFNLRMELLKLDNLGLSEKERSAVDDVIKHPTGLVLIVGPTGSGKTTTLYSLINTLNSPERKIITLEDPVEYFLPGVVQIPVAGDQDAMGFANHLRAVLRLDPDVVMVGEIRDRDTARTALQGALTGHLVLSTFHASSAAAALTRMLDAIGINPLFSSAMHLIMAQRLVRRLDDYTKEPFKPDKELRGQLQKVIDTLPPKVEKPDLSKATLYKAKPNKANPFGYKGQIAIREQLLMTPGVQKLLRLPPNEITTEMLEKKAVEEGMLTMLQDGVLKIINGQTTIEEVYRVVS
ncbi:MAG TPA: GspE/PulE family protein [Candidatus Saccharimonadales bacterium]|nr:GspE/PulE family protein [Candidatus Saccharimonadales bacterium]